MADAIDAAGGPATVGFQMRYDPWYSAIRDYLSDKWTASATMISAGGIEGHGRKHTHTELRGGPASPCMDRGSGTGPERPLWKPVFTRPTSSGTGPATRSSGRRRPTPNGRKTSTPSKATTRSPTLSHTGCRAAVVANLILTRPAGVFHPERYDYILTTHAMIKFEDDLVVYGGDGSTTGAGRKALRRAQSERARDRSPRRSDAVPQHPRVGQPIRGVDHPRTSRSLCCPRSAQV